MVFKKNRLDILLILGLLFLSPLFFFKLGQSSLVSWDEAWYAEVARNILKRGDLFNLWWNGKPFLDHPPAGFWFMALSFAILGVSEFSARAPSAFFGLLTLILTFLVGKKLFGRWVGFPAALALSSAPWFLYRARSGNLDIFLTFFFVLSIYLALLAKENKKLMFLFGLSLAFLFLTKSVAPFTIIPALVVIFWKKAVKISDFKKAFFGFILPFGVWLISQVFNNPEFIKRYLYIGLPGVSVKATYMDNLKLMKTYLHSGIGRWFWPSLFAVFAGLLTGRRAFYILGIFALSFFAPFLLSGRGQIWHLIPLYPFLVLSLFGFGFWAGNKILRTSFLTGLGILLISIYFSYPQIKRSWYEFIDIPAYVSDEAILAREASSHKEPLIIDGDFVPAATFYSEKEVAQTYRGGIKELFEKKEDFLLITHLWRLDEENISQKQYQVIKSDRDKVLIKKRF